MRKVWDHAWESGFVVDVDDDTVTVTDVVACTASAELLASGGAGATRFAGQRKQKSVPVTSTSRAASGEHQMREDWNASRQAPNPAIIASAPDSSALNLRCFNCQ